MTYFYSKSNTTKRAIRGPQQLLEADSEYAPTWELKRVLAGEHRRDISRSFLRLLPAAALAPGDVVPAGNVLGVFVLPPRSVLHDIGDAHVAVHEAQLSVSPVQCSEDLRVCRIRVGVDVHVRIHV